MIKQSVTCQTSQLLQRDVLTIVSLNFILLTKELLISEWPTKQNSIGQNPGEGWFLERNN